MSKDVEYTFNTPLGTRGAVTGKRYSRLGPGHGRRETVIAPEGEFDHVRGFYVTRPLLAGEAGGPGIPSSGGSPVLGPYSKVHKGGGTYIILKDGEDTGETVSGGKDVAQAYVDMLNVQRRNEDTG